MDRFSQPQSLNILGAQYWLQVRGLTVNRVMPKAANSADSQSPAAAATRARTRTARMSRAMPTMELHRGMAMTCGLFAAAVIMVAASG